MIIDRYGVLTYLLVFSGNKTKKIFDERDRIQTGLSKMESLLESQILVVLMNCINKLRN